MVENEERGKRATIEGVAASLGIHPVTIRCFLERGEFDKFFHLDRVFSRRCRRSYDFNREFVETLKQIISTRSQLKEVSFAKMLSLLFDDKDCTEKTVKELEYNENSRYRKVHPISIQIRRPKNRPVVGSHSSN